jgi:dihydroorotate dehydrogenase
VPDWSYQPLFRPLLFRLPAEPARDLTLFAMGQLAALPLGPALIDLLGHMQPPEGIQRTVCGITLPSAVGLGAGLDAHTVALGALARFGFGWLEVGPVTALPVRPTDRVERRVGQQALWYPDVPANDGLSALVQRLARIGPLPIPVGFRLAHQPGASAADATVERCQLIEQLAHHARFFTLETRWGVADGRWTPAEWTEHLAAVLDAVRVLSPARAVLLCLAPDLDSELVDRILTPAVALGLQGVVVSGGVQAPPSGRLVGAPSREQSLRLVRSLRSRWGDRVAIVGSGGVHEPADALDFFEAGATLVQLHSGLVYAGPGLPKRINDAVAYFETEEAERIRQPPAPARRKGGPPGWAWTALLGAGLILGGLLAWLVAATVVVLPYDEWFLGLSRNEIAAMSDRLLLFMVHDRVTLAGNMIALGLLYGGLAIFAIRRGMHWARDVVRISGTVGFGSFFLFLGFGYLDPLHGLVTVALLAFFLLGLRGPLPRVVHRYPNLHSDRRWLAGLWGQLILIVIGAGVLGTGISLAIVGITTTFVPEDLAFLQTTRDEVEAISPRLLPLIAHDRASLGGLLLADGLAWLLTALWGFRQGARWLWWTFAATGTVRFAAALGAHAAVGYTNTWHLTPVAVSLLLYVFGLVLSYGYLAAPRPRASLLAPEAS